MEDFLLDGWEISSELYSKLAMAEKAEEQNENGNEENIKKIRKMLGLVGLIQKEIMTMTAQ